MLNKPRHTAECYKTNAKFCTEYVSESKFAQFFAGVNCRARDIQYKRPIIAKLSQPRRPQPASYNVADRQQRQSLYHVSHAGFLPASIDDYASNATTALHSENVIPFPVRLASRTGAIVWALDARLRCYDKSTIQHDSSADCTDANVICK